MNFTGLFIYLKLSGFPYGWYNVVGYVGEKSNATSFLNITKPIIYCNGNYLQVLHESGVGITGLGTIANLDERQLLITDENYYTTILDTSSAVTGTIANDHPILYDISIDGISDPNNKYTYYTYTIRLDKDTHNATRIDSTTVYRYGPTLAEADSSVDLSTESNPERCTLTPSPGSMLELFPNMPVPNLSTLEGEPKYYYVEFNYANYTVKEGPQYGGSYNKRPQIYDGQKNLIYDAEYIDFENNRIVFKGNITLAGNYTLYIPSGIFLLNNTFSSSSVVAKYKVGRALGVDDFEYTYTPTAALKFTTIDFIGNFEFYRINTRDCGIYLGNSLVSTVSARIDDFSRSKITFTLDTALSNAGVYEDTEYSLYISPNALEIADPQGNWTWPLDVNGANLKLVLKAPENIPLSGYSISGPTRIVEEGTYTYKISPVPLLALNSDYELTYECEDPPTLVSLENGVLSVGALTDNMSFLVILTATSISNPKISESLTIKVAPTFDEIVKLNGIKIVGPSIISTSGTYQYFVNLSPLDTTLTDYHWEVSDLNYISFSDGLLQVNSLPTEDTITIKAISTLNSGIYGFMKIKVFNGVIPLKSMNIAGPRQLVIGLSALYSILFNPINSTNVSYSWGTAKMADSSSLASGYSFSNGYLSVIDDKDTLPGTVTLTANGPNGITDSITVNVIDPHIIVPASNIKELNVSGPVSINSTGDYSYKASFVPESTLETLVMWAIKEGYYPGISISVLGILQIKEMPYYNHDVVLRCTSAVNPEVYKDITVSLLSTLVNDEQQGTQSSYSFGSEPSSGVVSSVKDFKLNISTSEEIIRVLDAGNIIVRTPMGLAYITRMNILPSGSGTLKYYNISLSDTYTAEGNYSITFPEGFFNIGDTPSRSYTINYYILNSTSDNSDDHSATFGKLLAYNNLTRRTRIQDTVVLAEENGFPPSVYLTPSVYYIEDGNYKVVPEATVNLVYSYTSLSGSFSNTVNDIPYRKGYDLVENLLPTDVRTFEAIVYINFDNLTVTKHFSLEFVDSNSFNRILEDSNYSLKVTDLTKNVEEVKQVYGCSKLTGYELIQTILDESGTVHKLCDSKIVDVLRLGNLENVFNEKFGKKLPHGYGLYSENVYLTGEFLLSNGKSLLDVSDTITMAVGDTERVQAQIEKTKDDLLNSFKSTVKDLNDSLILMNNISEVAVNKLLDIGADGIIAVEEKASVRSNWATCINTFNEILTQIYNMRETISEDEHYDKVCAENSKLVNAFYDLNQLTLDLILNNNIKDVPIYDVSPGLDYAGISIYDYISDLIRIKSYIDKEHKEKLELKEENLEETQEGEQLETELEEFYLSTELDKPRVVIFDYTLYEDDLLSYITKEDKLLHPLYLYKTTEKITEIPEEERTEGRYDKTIDGYKAKLDYFNKEGLFTYNEIVKEYYSLLEKVLTLLGKALTSESLVEQFNKKGEKSADEAIRKFMGNLLDTAYHMGLDFATFALGSAGIAIVNPDYTYTINNKTFASYILDAIKESETKYAAEINEAKSTLRELTGKLEYFELLIKNELAYDEVEYKRTKEAVLRANEELHFINTEAVKNGIANYNYDLEYADKKDIDKSTVGDGDELLYLFGDKIKILTTSKIITSEGIFYKVSFDLGNGILEAYVTKTDLKKLKGNYTDQMLSYADKTSSISLYTHDDKDYIGISNQVVIGDGVPYYTYESSTKSMIEQGIIPSGVDVTIEYEQNAMFEGDKFNAKFIQAKSLVAGTFDEDTGELDESKDYVKIGVKEKEDDPIIEAKGGSFTLLNSENPTKVELTAEGIPGLYMYNQDGLQFAKFTGEEDSNPLGRFKNATGSTGGRNTSNFDIGTLVLSQNQTWGLNSAGYYLSKEIYPSSLTDGLYVPEIQDAANDFSCIVSFKPISRLLNDFIQNLNVNYSNIQSGTIDIDILPTIQILENGYIGRELNLGNSLEFRSSFTSYDPNGTDIPNFTSNTGTIEFDNYPYRVVYYNITYIKFKELSDIVSLTKGQSLKIFYRVNALLDGAFRGSIPSTMSLNLSFNNWGNYTTLTLGGTNNLYQCNFFGNGLALGTNSNNYFGAYTAPGDKTLSFEFLSNGYGMQYNANNINTVFAGLPLQMPYTIYAGKFVVSSRDHLTINYYPTHFVHFPTTPQSSTIASLKAYTDKDGRYLVSIYNIPNIDSIGLANLYISAIGNGETDGSNDREKDPVYVTILSYHFTTDSVNNTKTLNIYLTVSDDDSTNDGSFFIKVDYYTNTLGNNYTSSTTNTSDSIYVDSNALSTSTTTSIKNHGATLMGIKVVTEEPTTYYDDVLYVVLK